MSSPPERSCRLPTFMGSAAKAGALEALRPANAAALPKNCLRSIFMPLLPSLTGDNRQPRCCQPEVHARGPEPLYYLFHSGRALASATCVVCIAHPAVEDRRGRSPAGDKQDAG